MSTDPVKIYICALTCTHTHTHLTFQITFKFKKSAIYVAVGLDLKVINKTQMVRETILGFVH